MALNGNLGKKTLSGSLRLVGGQGASVVIDDTLSIAGAAADAKATGDALAGKAGVFWVTYGGTTNAEIEAAFQAGKIVLCNYNNVICHLAYRGDASTHAFEGFYGAGGRGVRQLVCASNQWINSTSTLVQSASPTFTGSPKAPTADPGTDTTQIATTAFVQNAIGGKISVSQGAANAGKVLAVGNDGTVSPQDVIVDVDATLTQQGEAADAKAVGDALAGKLATAQGSANAGKVLTVGNDGSVAPDDPPAEIFWATYGTTTSYEISDAVAAGKEVLCKYNNRVYRLTSNSRFTTFDGDKLYVVFINPRGEWNNDYIHFPQRAFVVDALGDKVDIAQGSGNAGKALVVGANGDVTLANYDATLAVQGVGADAKAVGDALAAKINISQGAGNAGKVLTVGSDGVVRPVTPSGGGGGGGGSVEELFQVIYGTTTNAEIETAFGAGKFCVCIYDGFIYPLTNRNSATKHIFSVVVNQIRKQIKCDGDTWSTSNVTLAQSADIPSLSSATPQDLGTAAAGSSTDCARADHVHKKPTAADVGAIPAPSSPSSGQFLVYNGSAWVAQTLATWQASSY